MLQDPEIMDLIERIEHDDRGFNTDGRILRLKHHLRSTSGPRVINAIIDALRHNTRVEALYLQAFEKVALLPRALFLLKRR